MKLSLLFAQNFMIQTANANLLNDVASRLDNEVLSNIVLPVSVPEARMSCATDSDERAKLQKQLICERECGLLFMTDGKMDFHMLKNDCPKKKTVLECVDRDCSKCEGVYDCFKKHDEEFVKLRNQIKETYATDCPDDKTDGKKTEYGICHAAPMARVGLLFALLALW